jgi:hypothetical protein
MHNVVNDDHMPDDLVHHVEHRPYLCSVDGFFKVLLGPISISVGGIIVSYISIGNGVRNSAAMT